MKLKISTKQLLELLINSWPAKDYFLLNGWILRFTNGVTSRANSVIPLRYAGNKKALIQDINLVEKAYAAFNLPATYTITDYYRPKSLVKELLAEDYQIITPTWALICSINQLNIQRIKNSVNFEFKDTRVKPISAFLAEYSHRSEYDQKIIEQISQKIVIPQKRYLIAKIGDEIVGTITGILEPRGYLYIADLLVKPQFRRNKIASALLSKLINDWALQNGASTIWLQVEKDNTVALDLYGKLRFSKAYSYYYLQKKVVINR